MPVVVKHRFTQSKKVCKYCQLVKRRHESHEQGNFRLSAVLASEIGFLFLVILQPEPACYIESISTSSDSYVMLLES